MMNLDMRPLLFSFAHRMAPMAPRDKPVGGIREELVPLPNGCATKAKEIRMIGKILGAIAGASVAEQTHSMSGPLGAVLGAGSAALIKRLSIPTLLVVGAGGYALKKWQDSREADKARRKSFETPPKAAAA